MFNQGQAEALASLIRQINERREDDALTPIYLNFHLAEALWSAIDAMQKELGHSRNSCGCVLGTCQSKCGRMPHAGRSEARQRGNDGQ